MTNPSNPFKHLATEYREMIETAYRAGKTPEQIGVQLGLDYDDVSYYLEHFLVAPRSHFERLQEIVDDLEDQCTKTKVEIDGGSNSAMMLQSYQKLMSEYRVALAELMAIQRPQEAVDDLVNKVFNPFVTELVRACAEETHKLQSELLKLEIPSRDAKGISVDVFRRLGERVQNLLPTTREGLDKHFGVNKKERNARIADADEAKEEREKTTLQ